jgi:hypothetical protein
VQQSFQNDRIVKSFFRRNNRTVNTVTQGYPYNWYLQATCDVKRYLHGIASISLIFIFLSYLSFKGFSGSQCMVKHGADELIHPHWRSQFFGRENELIHLQESNCAN